MKLPDMTIKAGDTVTFDKPDYASKYYHLTPGQQYTVKSVTHDGLDAMLEVAADDRGRGATWYAARFTKVGAAYQVGDTVECINNICGQRVGAQYLVEECHPADGVIKLAGEGDGWWTASRFKVVNRPAAAAPAAPVQWMVCALDSSGKIKPSSSPRLMAHERQAISVSKSMAEQHTGDTFAAVSFTVGSTFRAEAVEVKTVKHEVRQVG